MGLNYSVGSFFHYCYSIRDRLLKLFDEQQGLYQQSQSWLYLRFLKASICAGGKLSICTNERIFSEKEAIHWE